GRYQILFYEAKCVHPCSYNSGWWDLDANLVALWTAILDDKWSKASSKSSDIGVVGGYQLYKDSEGIVFTSIQGAAYGYAEARYGLVLATQLYDWGMSDQDAKDLAAQVKLQGETIGFTVIAATGASPAGTAAGAAITAIADEVSALIP